MELPVVTRSMRQAGASVILREIPDIAMLDAVCISRLGHTAINAARAILREQAMLETKINMGCKPAAINPRNAHAMYARRKDMQRIRAIERR